MLHVQHRKLKKSSSELADQLSSLSLQEATPQTGASVEQRLAQLEDIYSFPAADSSAFPQHHCQKFTTQLQELPSGMSWRTSFAALHRNVRTTLTGSLFSPLVFLCGAAGVTVCVLSVLEVQPGEIGDTLLLSRLEKGSAPVTVRIPTTQREVGKVTLSICPPLLLPSSTYCLTPYVRMH